MLLKSYFFKRITIVGVGLMGGSLGMTIKKHKLAKEVIGLSHRQSSLSEAIKREAIDTGYIDVKKAIQNADLVILATPVNEIIKLLSTIAPHLRRTVSLRISAVPRQLLLMKLRKCCRIRKILSDRIHWLD